VAAADIDPLAAAAQRLNAALNAVTIESVVDDLIGCAVTAEVILAGDVCYDRADTERTLPWLRELAGGGTLVLLADPGRHYAPSAGIELLATYDIPTLHELESQPEKRTRLWRLLP
jgi:predicted nicotinamide N-methyase